MSLKAVSETALGALPSFPALRELMPVELADSGFRHVGRLRALESLVLMYCRETTDAATEELTQLPALASYFNSYTAITDRTPELLAGLPALEQVTLASCHGLTNAGVGALARLPRLRELRVSGRRLTRAAAKPFPPTVRILVGD